MLTHTLLWLSLGLLFFSSSSFFPASCLNLFAVSASYFVLIVGCAIILIVITFLDLEKAYDRVDRDAVWNVLRLYGISGRLLQGVKSLYVGSKACLRVGNEVSGWLPMRVGLRQGYVMSPWLFNVYIDGVVREVNARVLGRGLKLIDGNDNGWELNQLLFVDDTVVVSDS